MLSIFSSSKEKKAPQKKARTKMVEVVRADGPGYFKLSIEALKYMGCKVEDWLDKEDWNYHYMDNREAPELISAIKALGGDVCSDDACAKLKIVEVPGDRDYYVEWFDGGQGEKVLEYHNTY